MSGQYGGKTQKGTGLADENTDAGILKADQKIVHPFSFTKNKTVSKARSS